MGSLESSSATELEASLKALRLGLLLLLFCLLKKMNYYLPWLLYLQNENLMFPVFIYNQFLCKVLLLFSI